MKLKHTIIYLLLFGIVVSTSCTDKYKDYNEDPSGAIEEEVQRRYYALCAAMTGMQSWVVPIDVNACQFTDCLLGGSFGGYLADSNSGFNGKNFSTYNPEEHWIKVAFNDVIPEIFIRHDKIKNLTEGQPIPRAISDIVRVLAISRITDVYLQTNVHH